MECHVFTDDNHIISFYVFYFLTFYFRLLCICHVLPHQKCPNHLKRNQRARARKLFYLKVKFREKIGNEKISNKVFRYCCSIFRQLKLSRNIYVPCVIFKFNVYTCLSVFQKIVYRDAIKHKIKISRLFSNLSSLILCQFLLISFSSRFNMKKCL